MSSFRFQVEKTKQNTNWLCFFPLARLSLCDCLSAVGHFDADQRRPCPESDSSRENSSPGLVVVNISDVFPLRTGGRRARLMGRERAAAAAPQETLGWRIGLKWESDLQSRDERLRRPGTPYRCLRPFQPASERPRTSAASGLESACTPPPRACVGKVLSGRVPVPAYRTFLTARRR